MRLRALSAVLAIVAVVVSIAVAVPLHAQGLREHTSELFIFGAGQDPLFLAGSADPSNPLSIREHGTHFIPASAADNASVISFITDAVGSSVANVPVGSTSGGETLRFEGGVPVTTSTSAGPIFAERAATIHDSDSALADQLEDAVLSNLRDAVRGHTRLYNRRGSVLSS